MKTCPFCDKKPAVADGLVTCHVCGISLPEGVWDGQRDIAHTIDGKEWITDGHRIWALDDGERLPAYCKRRVELTGMMAGEWVKAKPDGYFRANGIGYVHRYMVGDVEVAVDAAKEEDYDLCYLVVHAKAHPGGYIMRYSLVSGSDAAKSTPVLYLASLRLGTVPME